MIRALEVHDLEQQALSPAVALVAKGNVNPNGAHRCMRDTRHDAVEGGSAWLHHILGYTEFDHGVSVHDVDAAPVVHENPGKSDIDAGPDECRIQH